MSRLAAWIGRVARSANLRTSLLTGIVDDGTGGTPAVGEPTPLRVNQASGALNVQGPGGDLATEVTVDRTADAAEALVGTIAPGSVVAPGQDAIAVVNAIPPPTFAAAPGSGETLEATYLAGAGAQLADARSVIRYVIITRDPGRMVTRNNTIGAVVYQYLAHNGPCRLASIYLYNNDPGKTYFVRTWDRATTVIGGAATTESQLVHHSVELPSPAFGAERSIPFIPPVDLASGCLVTVEDTKNASTYALPAVPGNGIMFTVQLAVEVA